MVSSPSFNPNWADVNSPNSFWGDYFPDDAGRFFNRATQGQYPPGSIFKVITMSAGLESGLFEPTDTLDCQNQWYGLAGTVLDNWTVEKELPPDGTLTLVEGLMRSCNPWFYQIGLDLFNEGQSHLIHDMANGFGLGSPTGIQTLVEETGAVEIPGDDPEIGRREAVQQGIGQGTTTITPLQAAVYAAAIGNGGTLYRPQLIERVENTDGSVVLQFQPEANGSLPISDATMAALREGMRMVTTNARGTAYRRFTGFGLPVYGKTGTATVEGNDPHAWFIGFTDAGQPNNPDIAIAVLVENIGDGSEFAAPIFRRVASYYFFGTPGPLYSWESQFGELDPEYFEETPEGEENPEATPEEDGPIVVTPSP
jgi:penicillin-binding protein 2